MERESERERLRLRTGTPRGRALGLQMQVEMLALLTHFHPSVVPWGEGTEVVPTDGSGSGKSKNTGAMASLLHDTLSFLLV